MSLQIMCNHIPMAIKVLQVQTIQDTKTLNEA